MTATVSATRLAGAAGREHEPGLALLQDQHGPCASIVNPQVWGSDNGYGIVEVMKAALFPAATVTLNSKGQFCIPKRICEQLGIASGMRLEIELVADGFVLRVPSGRRRRRT